MVVAGGDPAFHWPFAALSGVVASRAPRRVRRTLVEGACEAARSGNRSRRFLFWLAAARAASLQWNRLAVPLKGNALVPAPRPTGIIHPADSSWMDYALVCAPYIRGTRRK